MIAFLPILGAILGGVGSLFSAGTQAAGMAMGQPDEQADMEEGRNPMVGGAFSAEVPQAPQPNIAAMGQQQPIQPPQGAGYLDPFGGY